MRHPDVNSHVNSSQLFPPSGEERCHVLSPITCTWWPFAPDVYRSPVSVSFQAFCSFHIWATTGFAGLRGAVQHHQMAFRSECFLRYQPHEWTRNQEALTNQPHEPAFSELLPYHLFIAEVHPLCFKLSQSFLPARNLLSHVSVKSNCRSFSCQMFSKRRSARN